MDSFVIWDVCYINLSKSMQKQVPVRARVFANFYANLCSRHQKWQNCSFPTRKIHSNWQFLFYLPQKWTVCVWWDFLTFLAKFRNTCEKNFMHTNISPMIICIANIPSPSFIYMYAWKWAQELSGQKFKLDTNDSFELLTFLLDKSLMIFSFFSQTVHRWLFIFILKFLFVWFNIY